MASKAETTALGGPILEVLRIVTEERNTYGLRHQDFSRYRSHCTRKVHNLRKATGLTQQKGKKYAKKNVTAELALTHRHILIPIFEAERAWAYSRELREKAAPPSEEATKVVKAARVRHHANNRLLRGTSHAATVLSLLPPSADVASRAQAHSYALYLKGMLHFDRSEWPQGLGCLSTAMTLLMDLAERPGASAHEIALANEWVDEVSPLARFCAYKLDVIGDIAIICREKAEGGDAAKWVEGWDELKRELRKGDGSERRKIDAEWRGVKIDVRNAELVDVFANVETALRKLAQARTRPRFPSATIDGEVPEGAKKWRRRPEKQRIGLKASAYDSALLVLSDAEDMARRLVDDNAVALTRSHSARFEASTVPLRKAHAYIAYHLLSTRIERDRALVHEELQKLERREGKARAKVAAVRVHRDVDRKLARKRARIYPSLVKLYDGIILSLEQMRELSLVEEDVDVSADVDVRIAFISARRCAIQARTYDILSRFPEALSLNQRAKLYIRQARSQGALTPLSAEDEGDDSESPQRFLPVAEGELTTLEADLDSDYQRFAQRWFNHTGGHTGTSAADLQPSDLQVDALSLDRKGNKTKPAVFDVAFNYAASIPFNELAIRAGLKAPAVRGDAVAPMQGGEKVTDHVVVGEKQEPPASKRGIWGLFSRG